jgi:hypothetical protein
VAADGHIEERESEKEKRLGWQLHGETDIYIVSTGAPLHRTVYNSRGQASVARKLCAAEIKHQSQPTLFPKGSDKKEKKNSPAQK